MRTVSPYWVNTLATSHILRVRVEVWSGGVKQAEVPMSAGTLTLDMDAENYGNLDLELADPALLSSDTLAGSLLPYGQRLRVYYALQTPAGLEEIAIDCEFLITKAPTAAGWLSETAVGASTVIEMIKDDRFLVPYQPTASASVQATLTSLITASVPGAGAVTYTMADKTLSSSPVVYERERWEAVADLVDKLDGWLRPTLTGFRVATIQETVGGASVWSVRHGINLLGGTRPTLTRDDRYNAVVAFNPEDPAVWAAAYVTDAAHPARWSGPYGHRPAFFGSPLLATVGAAQAAANTRLSTINGKARTMTVQSIANPAIEPGDVIDIVWPNSVLEQVQVRKVELPLVPGPMTLTVQGNPS